MRQLALLALFAVVISQAFGQNNNTANGYIPGHSYVSKDIDSVDIATGLVSLNIPLLSFKEQDPVSIDYSLSYTSHHFAYVISQPSIASTQNQWAWIDPFWLPTMPSAELIGGTATSYGGVHLASNQDWRYSATPDNDFPEVISPDGGTHVMLNDINGYSHSTDGTGLSGGGPVSIPGATYADVEAWVTDSSGVSHGAWSGPILGAPGSRAPLYLNRDNTNVPQVVFGADQRPAYISDALGRQLPWADLFTGNIGAPTTDYSKCVGTLPVDQAFKVTFPNGTYLFCYTTIALQTNFDSYQPNAVGGREYAETREFLQSVYLPNGRSWIFEYQDRDPNDTSNVNYGTLTKVTYPTGGSISYTYGFNPECAYEMAISGPSTDIGRRLLKRTETDINGQSASWNYSYTTGTYTAIAEPCDPLNCDSPTMDYQFANNATVLVLAPDQSSVLHTFYEDATTCVGQELSTIEYDSQKKVLGSQKYWPIMVGYPVIFTWGLVGGGGTETTYEGNFAYAPSVSEDILANGQVMATVEQYDQEAFYTEGTCGTQSCLVQYPAPGGQLYSFKKEIQKWVYDYGEPTPGFESGPITLNPTPPTSGQLLQRTTTTYEFQSNMAALGLNMLDLVDAKTPYGTGNSAANLITNKYATTGAYGVYGNAGYSPYLITLTNTTAQINSSTNAVTSYFYDAIGNATSMKDANSHTTIYVYDPTGTYRISTTSPIATDICTSTQTSTFTNYNFLTGTVQATTDENCNKTTYGYDEMLRLTSVTPPDTSVSGAVNLCYGEDINQSCADAVTGDPTNTIYARVAQNASASVRAKQSYDGFGRPYISGYRDNTGWIDTQTGYDLVGRTQSISLPYREGNSPSGLSWTDYDGRGRVIDQKQENASGVVISETSKQYTNNLIDLWDGDQHHSQQQLDGLGRLTYVKEPDATNSPSIETDYSYDPLGNLVGVNQKGQSVAGESSRTRQFTYDSLSRLVAAFNPETGTGTGTCPGASQAWSICYGYDGVGNLTSKTDARGYVTSMAYDPLNRLLSKVYYAPSSTTPDPGTPSTCFQYDLSNLTNYKGQLAAEWTQSGTCASTMQSLQSSSILTSRTIDGYDTAGRVTSETKCLLGTCYPSGTYSYDLVGNLTQYFNRNVNVMQTYDAANRLQTITAVNPTTSQAMPLYSVTSVGPAGPLTINLGSSMTKIRTYDSLQRPTSETTIKTPQ